MREVSCRALAPMLAHLDARGIPRSELVEGTGANLALLERSSQRIDWELFGDICVRLEALVGLEGMAEIGASAPNIPAMRTLSTLLGALTNPAALYDVMLKVVGPSMFHNAITKLEDLGGGRLRVTIAIPPEYREVPGVFYIFLGGLRINPTLCGYPPAQVEMVLGRREAVYDVRFARAQPSLLQRVWATLRGLLRLPPGFQEMEAQRTELRANYEALREAQRQIRRQHAMLRRSKQRRRQAEAARSLAEEQFHRAQKLEGIGLLAGGIAHDFNNLLAGILGNAELAMREAESDPSRREPVVLRLERIERGAQRAAELTSQLLAYAGRRPPSMREIDVNALIGETQRLLRLAIPRNIVMLERLTPDLPGVSGDPSQLQQVVMNLLTNAAAAAESNGGEVTLQSGLTHVDAARLARGWLRPRVPLGEYVFIEVRDTGIGMDDATLTRIFDPFFTTRAEGRGLGLAAVLGIVRGHMGLIEVVSAPGAGSTFRVLLPSLGHPAAQLAISPRAPLVLQSGTMLVADDDASVLESTSDLLRALGYSVIPVSGGDAVLAAARRIGTGIDAFIIDRTMPGMSGEEVFHALRAIRPDAQVILCSGYHDEDGLAALEAAGLAASISKPFGSAELVVAIARARNAALLAAGGTRC
ncbi:MAG: ATP-binding protein [Pseudomonadota bacterium]|nr:ATP-binding protein [Pseudomonadota bacterium]